MKVLAEFKQFVQRGNVLDMAVGIVIGAAFGKIVTALVEGIITPPIGWLLSGIDFSQVGITLSEPTEANPGKALIKIQVGRMIQAVIDFLIVAACLFMAIKAINRLRGPEPEKPKHTADDVQLLMEIRDLLKAKT